MASLLGDVLLTKDGEKPTAEVLKGKVVGLYFSAHWCPPCRGFTPMLAKAYTDHLKAKGLEIVFVSSDRDESAFSGYYGEQPWCALPYADRERKDKISKKFKVQGIPTFVLLDESGEVITTNGREKVSEDPKGEAFPWKPKPLSELLDFPVQTKNGVQPMSSLDGKVLGLYFSAHWCPPCRGFTPKLAEKYTEIMAKGLPFEMIFVSSDRDEAAFNEYFGEQPWCALPFAERQRKEELSGAFEVQGIPTLVLIDTDRTVITTNGRGAIMQDLKDFPFHPKPVTDLAVSADGINDAPAVLILADGADAAGQDLAMAALEPVATEYVQKAKAAKEDPEIVFFTATKADGAVPRVRELCKLPTPAEPTMLLLDVSDNGAYYRSAGHAITEQGVRDLISDFKAGKLTKCQFGQ